MFYKLIIYHCKNWFVLNQNVGKFLSLSLSHLCVLLVQKLPASAKTKKNITEKLKTTQSPTAMGEKLHHDIFCVVVEEQILPNLRSFSVFQLYCDKIHAKISSIFKSPVLKMICAV